MRIRAGVWFAVAALLLGSATLAQVNTVELVVKVFDPSEAAIVGATVQVKNLATSATRTQASDGTGTALFVGLPPGRYQVTVEMQNFSKLVNPDLVLTIGQAAEFHAHMKIASGSDVVTVTEATELIEIRRTGTSTTVDQRRIDNLPINGRNYINFTLTDSQAQRDSAPSIGAAPTSVINFGGQRARSNQVSVDGADATDNSINGVRSTVSQEAVQEFQLIVSNYMPEFGRATGGVINIVTKGGSNDVRGNIFGYLRHKNIQARNPFSVEIDPATSQPVAVKQGYTRFQGGATIGGPIAKDRTFYFFSYETTQRQESGFTDIGRNNFDLVPVTSADTPLVAPGLTLLMTPAQRTFVVSGSASTTVRSVYALLAGASSNVALNRDMGAAVAGALVALGFPPGPGGTASFPLPVAAVGRVSLPASFVGLNSLRGNYPISEHTHLYSARLDHQWNDKNNSFVRVNVSPSKVTGIQVNAQNQNFGQNAGTRTSLNQIRDVAIVGQHVTSFTTSLFNEARFQFARRGLHYGFAEFPGGSGVGVNITGYAFFGREPFSTVDRIERRWQWQDNVSWTKGRHNLKFGGDINLIQLRSKKDQIFELNFGGLYNFGSVGSGPILSSILGAAITGTPDFTPVQAYGLGLPTVFIQGIGRSDVPFENKTFAFFGQDSWRVHPRFTVNYGVRYDVELTPVFSPSTPLNAAAEPALGILTGIPRDKNNWSPRFGFAWDPWGNSNTVVRGGYGVFFDHP
ncbi:MAG TPA: TonB-dependent receptor, partial [Terriglobia bacterium]